MNEFDDLQKKIDQAQAPERQKAEKLEKKQASSKNMEGLYIGMEFVAVIFGSIIAGHLLDKWLETKPLFFFVFFFFGRYRGLL